MYVVFRGLEINAERARMGRVGLDFCVSVLSRRGICLEPLCERFLARKRPPLFEKCETPHIYRFVAPTSLGVLHEPVNFSIYTTAAARLLDSRTRSTRFILVYRLECNQVTE